ncbi:MAG: cytochrome c oxidase assembly protein [Alphaproteobacteria bacterium]|nr:cytochrome c oxidase assembly protein [Alphaproteobacteria bacterium]MDE2110623.1 cytochrome c oxidase assembly protein [Alphaproteobacteria bacterium]MDE2495052.1 cytochrome c oxidase assembly protein [Alphaproteobacteria bacterium]
MRKMAAMTLPKAKSDRTLTGWLAYGAVLGVGAVVYVLCRFFPADLPVWMPWEFSWPVFLLTILTLGWFIRGLWHMRAPDRPPIWRRVLFVLGVLLSYAAVQTRYDYLSQHMFFFHRFQHLVLHHLGPFLIALGGAGSVVWRGIPAFLKPILKSSPIRGAVDFIQHPAVAPVVFVGLIYLWLIPDIHARVMLDDNLYDLMNWSMAVDGIFFWCLVLDPRSKPPARLGMGIRALLVGAVVPPQILIGALLALTNKDVYPVYKICGRILPISAIADQHYGGLILWIPSSMMSVVALLLILNNLRLADEKAEKLAAG